tara:strand:- start:412 stop:720 length:309 start_codon:yes stop_codon:yes gene_type:complete
MKYYKVEWLEIFAKIETIKDNLQHSDFRFYGMDNNAKIITYLLGKHCDDPNEADIFIGSVYDNDLEFSYFTEKWGDKEFCFFYNKEIEHKNKKIVFPWEIIK